MSSISQSSSTDKDKNYKDFYRSSDDLNRGSKEVLTIEQLLESIVEAIRKQRRWGPRYPTPYDLSKIVWNTEHRRIEMDLYDNGKIRKFDLLLDEVNEHGETSSVDVDETEENND